MDAPHPDERRIEHICRHGTRFRARANLKSGVEINGSEHLNRDQLAADAAQFAAWHAIVIYPTLNGFAGYDTVQFHEMKNS